MAEIIDNTLTCPFCKCKFKVDKDDVKIVKEWSSVGYYHYDVYKKITCPICGETAVEKYLRAE